jgi:DNA invertase Pin-like site-specific DNA recombinase
MQKNTTVETTTKAVIYARYSSDRQREESIEGQLRVCEDFAKRNGMTILHVYADRALSGRSDQRPEFQMMIQAAATQAFDTVLVYKLNRFARNRYDSAKYKHKLKKYGVKVVSAMENIANDPSGILLESVIEGMAEYYSAELAENVMRGMTENALECKWPGGTVPLGYKLDAAHHLIIDEPAAKTVRWIYQMALEGRQPSSIIRELNAAGCRTAFGRPFGRTSLNTILKNERYIGAFVWNDIKKPNAIPAIVNPEDWQKVQEITKAKKKCIAKSRGENYLLTGRLFCGQCGGSMVGTAGTSKMQRVYHYYDCGNHLKKKGCTTKAIRADKLEDIICNTTTQLLSNQEAISAIAKQAISAQKEQGPSLVLQSLQNQRTEISRKLQNCIKAVEKGLISQTVTNHIQDYEKQLQTLNDDIRKEELMNQVPRLTEKHIEFFFWSISQQIKKADKYKSILLSSLVRSVIIYGDFIEIQYNYKKELPILQNPVKIKSSYLNKMVIHPGFEPGTP